MGICSLSRIRRIFQCKRKLKPVTVDKDIQTLSPDFCNLCQNMTIKNKPSDLRQGKYSSGCKYVNTIKIPIIPLSNNKEIRIPSLVIKEEKERIQIKEKHSTLNEDYSTKMGTLDKKQTESKISYGSYGSLQKRVFRRVPQKFNCKKEVLSSGREYEPMEYIVSEVKILPTKKGISFVRKAESPLKEPDSKFFYKKHWNPPGTNTFVNISDNSIDVPMSSSIKDVCLKGSPWNTDIADFFK